MPAVTSVGPTAAGGTAKRWRFATHDAARVAALQAAAGIPAVLAQLLLGRGVEDPTAAQQFLEPKLTGLRDPELLPGVNQAAELLHKAIAAKRKIVVYGDYDADGMTATAILLRCLKLLGADASFYVPHRLDEGYGLNGEALRTLAGQGVHTVVTVDCGVAAVAEAKVAQELGLQLIITDHHQFAAEIPAAAAIIHPQLPGHDYPFAGLCGAAVAFKLAWALCQRASEAKKVSEPMRRFLLQGIGLAAIGAVADVVPLIDENRILVRHGLLALRNHGTAGVVALEKIAGLSEKTELEGEDIAFALAPRLNAAGRLGRAELGIELLLTDCPDRAADLATFVNELNQQRQSLERSVLLAARKQIKANFKVGDPAFVLADHDWHPGVIGIVAGKLVEQYQRPVVMVALDKTGVRPGIGSGRSAPGCNLAQAFAACSELLVTHGGHAAAAGLRIEERRLADFRLQFNLAVAEQLGETGACGEIFVDAEAPLAALTHQMVTQLERMAPFGHGNLRPTLCTTDVRLASPPKRMGAEGRHLSLEIEQHGVKIRAVSFGNGDWEEQLLSVDGPLTIAYRPVLNTFRGWQKVELRLEDWRAADGANGATPANPG